MGAVNAVVNHHELEKAAIKWAKKINAELPQSQKMINYAFLTCRTTDWWGSG